MMLPKVLRLQKPGDFERLYKRGRRLSSRHFQVLYSLQKDQNSSRFGFVVSKKQVKTIVARNRQKRVLRAQVWNFRERLMPGFDIVIQPRSSAFQLSPREKKEEILNLLQKARLIKL